MLTSGITVRRSSLLLTIGLAVAFASPPLAHGADAVSGQLIVGVKRQTAPAELTAIVERAGGRLKRRLNRIDAAVIRAGSGEKLSIVRQRLADHPGVRYVEPDYVLARSRAPDDPFYVRQYALQPSAGGVSAPAAWDQRTNCSLVAVLDSGVQYDHPDLKGNVWHNSGEKKSNGKDDDDNGYVNDYYGADVRDAKGSGGDTEGHGSHVAGIIAADGDNATGVTGACWSGSIMPVAFMDSRGRGATSDAVAGIDYSTYPESKYKELSGTSMAAPLVAAAAAMLRARDSKLSYSDIRSLLKASVDPIPALTGKVVTGGRLNIARALERASS